MALEVLPVRSRREKNIFLSFPWKLYRQDRLWVPPIWPERLKATDPARGPFFKDGMAEFFIAWRDHRPVGTLCCAEDRANTRFKGQRECMLGFFECVQDYAAAAALFEQAQVWACEHDMKSMYGIFNLDREESRGVLVDGYDRPAPVLCGHNPPYYAGFFERFGFTLDFDDGLAYAVDLDADNPRLQRLFRLADRVRLRKNVRIRSVDMQDIECEIDRITDLQNRALAHLKGFTPYTRAAIASMLLPLKDLADPDLVLFAELDGKAIGWFPGIPNFNEILIHLNGLRYPWDYLRALWYQHRKPECISIKSIVVPPEYWDTGVAVLLFDEMVKRAIARGYKWADLSLTGEENPDTWALAHHMGGRIYKRYRFYRKMI